jgi:hypothetical protein
LPSKDTGQWLNKDTFLSGDFVWQYKHTSVHINLRNSDIFSKSSRIEIGVPKGITDRMETIETIMTCIAGDMMRDEDPIADLIFFYPFPYLDNLSCDLMAEHPGCLFDSIPFHDITATNPTGQHPD